MRSPAAGRTLEIGEVNVYPTHRVRGRLILTDQDRPPGHIVAVLERFELRDLLEVLVESDGSFTFEAVPSESVVLSFHSWHQHAVIGYRLSPQNPCLDAVLKCTLCGSVEEDCQLNVLLEPGSSNTYTPGQMAKTASGGQVRGRIIGVGNGQVVRETVPARIIVTVARS